MINSGLLPQGEGGRGRRSGEEGKEERGGRLKAGWGRKGIRCSGGGEGKRELEDGVTGWG